MAPPARGASRASLAALAFSGATQLVACGADEGAATPLSAVLVTFDTTRADAVGPQAGRTSVTPHLDALAAESLVFTDAHTVAPLTLPAHASLFTGLYPPRHGVRDNGHGALPAAATTLAELAREASCATAAFVGARVLDAAFGLGQGFDVYDVPARRADGRASEIERPAAATVDAALAWLEGAAAGRRFFLWVHLFEPHDPYDPPRRFLRASDGDAYRGEIAAADDALGRLVAGLRDQGHWDECVLVVAGDHGEALGQHGEPTHGVLTFEETLRVPLVLRDPRRGAKAGVSDALVSLVDVFPTLVAALGLAAPADHDGIALGKSRADRGLYFESWHGYISFGWSPLVGWLEGERKSLLGGAPLAFDLGADPAELRPLADDAGTRALLAAHQGAIEALYELPRLPLEEATFDATLLADLRALGYLAAGTAADAPLPAPFEPEASKDRKSAAHGAAELRELLQARGLAVAGRLDEALPRLQALVTANPRNWAAWDALGLCFLRRGEHAPAAQALERVVREGPPWASARHNLGLALRALGRNEEALAAFRAALAVDPGYAPALEEARSLALALGQTDEAREYERRLGEQP